MKGGADTEYLTELWKTGENTFGAQITIIKDPLSKAAEAAKKLAKAEADALAKTKAAKDAADAKKLANEQAAKDAAAAKKLANEQAAKDAAAAKKLANEQAAKDAEAAAQLKNFIISIYIPSYNVAINKLLDIIPKDKKIIEGKKKEDKYKDKQSLLTEMENINNLIKNYIEQLKNIETMKNDNKDALHKTNKIFEIFGTYNIKMNIFNDGSFKNDMAKRMEIKNKIGDWPDYDTISIP